MEYTLEFYKNILDNISDGIYFVDLEKKITYWNKGAEKITGFNSEEVLGSKCSDNILNHISGCGENMCKGGCPLQYTLNDGFEREAEVYLSHKSGARLPVRLKTTPIYDKDKNMIGAVEIFSDNSSAISAYEMADKLRKLAFIDDITNLPNKKYMEIKIENLINELEKHNVVFGMIIAKIENYEELCEKSGIENGHKVLNIIAKTLKAIIAPYYNLGRFEENSFVIVVPNVNETDFNEFKNRLRIIVSNCNLGTIKLTENKDEKINLCFSGGIVKEKNEIADFFTTIA
ncbi:MAG: diguanylate cyclase [Candidatus Muirbacterium halophilum]|nr:diguanylate cyclase [Candidatus Muirbacterium halophilum]MCK9474570.1 diguanylate cyclase [Candidatus Muirbacterium halophilum]